MNEAPKGYVKLARRAFAADGGDPLWLEEREFSRWEAWVDVIQLAAWKPWRFVTKYGPIDLQRGEFVASLRHLADRWTWSVKKVRTWLATLEKWARLKAQQKTEAGTVYLIVNYERYQSSDDEKETAKGTPSGTAGAQRGHKREAVKQVVGESITAGKSLAAADATGALALTHSWPEEAAGWWQETVGRMAPGRIGKVLKPFVEKYTWPAVKVALMRWVVERQAQNRSLKVEWFADECVPYLTQPAPDILDEFGALTAYGKRMVGAVKHA